MKNEEVKINIKPFTKQFYRGNSIYIILALFQTLFITGANLLISWLIQQIIDMVSGVDIGFSFIQIMLFAILGLSMVVVGCGFTYFSKPRFISMNDKEKQKILNTNWFQDFRKNRNFLIHKGAGCLVYGNKTEILFSVMRIDEMEREEEINLDEYFLTDNMLIRYHRFWGIMLSELILFCESIFEFLLSKSSVSEDKKYVLNITNYSKRMFKTEENPDKQTILENMLNLILMEENIN